MKCVCVANVKGGTAKTTTTLNLATGYAKLGYRVLALDFDPQANLTRRCNLSIDRKRSIYEALLKPEKAKNYTHKTKFGFDILSSKDDLFFFEDLMKQHTDDGKIKTYLSDVLKTLSEYYDYVFIDCNPSVNQLMIEAIASTNGAIVITGELSETTIDGINLILGIRKDVKNTSTLIPVYYLPIRVLSDKYNLQKLDAYRSILGSLMLETSIRDGLKEVSRYEDLHKAIINKRVSKVGSDYRALLEELVRKGV